LQHALAAVAFSPIEIAKPINSLPIHWRAIALVKYAIVDQAAATRSTQ
jgi:hypothetical protein